MSDGDAVEAKPRFVHRIGRILRAHGLKGDVLVQVFRPRSLDPSQLEMRRERPARAIELVHEDGREEQHDVLGVRWINPSGFVAHLSGLSSREAAEAASGAYFDVDPQDAPSIVIDDVDRVFGARVVDDETGREIGEVEDIRDNGAQAVLVVGAAEILIPWVDAFITGVDDSEDPVVVRVRPIPGLLDANER